MEAPDEGRGRDRLWHVLCERGVPRLCDHQLSVGLASQIVANFQAPEVLARAKAISSPVL